jgi:hypothetical protein
MRFPDASTTLTFECPECLELTFRIGPLYPATK